MNFVSEYIKYLYNAKGRHGIHSPFVYEFVDVCLRLRPDPEFNSRMKVLRNTLSADRTLVEVTDFGAGSRKLGKFRSVRSIYKTASCKGVYARLLYQLAKHYQPQNILEFGTSLGLGTIHLAAGQSAGNKGGKMQVVSVDACANTIEIARKNINSFFFKGESGIELVNQTFDNFLSIDHPPRSPFQGGSQNSSLDDDIFRDKFDLVYIDGHHNGEALKKYMSQLKDITHKNTIFVLDDIRWSDDMFEAWNELRNMETYHLSMDLFRMGILVPRPGQVKEHFTVKLKNVLSGF